MLQEVSDKVCIHELYITSHRKFSKKDLYYFALSFGFSVATLLSSGVRVYIQPLDQYISNTFPTGIMRISGKTLMASGDEES